MYLVICHDAHPVRSNVYILYFRSKIWYSGGLFSLPTIQVKTFLILYICFLEMQNENKNTTQIANSFRMLCFSYYKSYLPTPWRDSISRPIAPQAETIRLENTARSENACVCKMKNKHSFLFSIWVNNKWVVCIPGSSWRNQWQGSSSHPARRSSMCKVLFLIELCKNA
jgi:hypothetical protein